jgi:hypothetical protein
MRSRRSLSGVCRRRLLVVTRPKNKLSSMTYRYTTCCATCCCLMQMFAILTIAIVIIGPASSARTECEAAAFAAPMPMPMRMESKSTRTRSSNLQRISKAPTRTSQCLFQFQKQAVPSSLAISNNPHHNNNKSSRQEDVHGEQELANNNEKQLLCVTAAHLQEREKSAATATPTVLSSMKAQALIFLVAGSIIISFGTVGVEPAAALASYSNNARNMERLASGDSSGGSVYDNYPTTKAGQKRRAMTGCRIPTAREQATASSSWSVDMNMSSERECNLRVMDGDTDFMLQALRELDCPTCPYGVSPTTTK